MQIKKVTTHNISQSAPLENVNSPDSTLKLGIAASADKFEMKNALNADSFKLFESSRFQPTSNYDSILEAKAKLFGETLRKELKKYGIEVDEIALANFAGTILKGGKDGILNTIGFIYGIIKLSMGSPQSDEVQEFLTSLINNPQHAEEIAMPVLTDPNFLPISDEQLLQMYRLESNPIGVKLLFEQIVVQKLREMEPMEPTEPISSEELDSYREKIDSYKKLIGDFEDVIPTVFGNLGTVGPPSIFENFFQKN
jgi:hypothetical protein